VLGELQANVIMNRNILREHLLAETLEDKLKVEKAIAANFEHVAKSRHAYELLIPSPEERALYTDWSRIFEEYRKGSEEVMALSRKAAGQVAHEAHEFNAKTVNRLLTDADVILRKDIDLNNAGADKAAAEAAENYAWSFAVLSALAGTRRCRGHRRQLRPDPRCHERDRVHRGADAGAGAGRPVRPCAASGREDRNRRHGRYAAGVQESAGRQEGPPTKRRQRTPKPRSSAGRRVDNITREFEQMIGEIVNTVSSASSQLEASADTLANTAQRSKELATAVSAALGRGHGQCAIGRVPRPRR